MILHQLIEGLLLQVAPLRNPLPELRFEVETPDSVALARHPETRLVLVWQQHFYRRVVEALQPFPDLLARRLLRLSDEDGHLRLC